MSEACISESTPALRKHGPKRRPAEELTASGRKGRRYRDRLRARTRLKECQDAGIPAPQEVVTMLQYKRGRPSLSPEELARPEHTAARKKRLHAASDLERGALLALLQMATEAVHTREADQAEAEQTAARRARALLRLEHTLGICNPAADGPHTLVQPLHAAPPADADAECPICRDTCNGCSRTMRCCGALICKPCLSHWFQQHGKRQPVGYGEGPDGRSGRAVSEPLQTHQCPFCRAPCMSARRCLL